MTKLGTERTDRQNKIIEWKAEAAMIYDKPKEIAEYVKDKINQYEIRMLQNKKDEEEKEYRRKKDDAEEQRRAEEAGARLKLELEIKQKESDDRRKLDMEIKQKEAEVRLELSIERETTDRN